MENRILIAIDLSENSLKAVEYVGEVMACHPDFDIVLLNVVREPSPDIMPDDVERNTYVEKMKNDTLRHMEAAARLLTSRGIPEKKVHIKIQVCGKPVSVADLILQEQAEGKYRTVVIGRRGVSKKQEFLFGSISKKVVTEAKDCAVWVIE